MGFSETRLHDLHCHLDFINNALEVAADAAAAGTRIFATTVTPLGYLQAHMHFATVENVALGLGLHPWYLAQSANIRNQQLELFANVLPSTSFVGEVGLDLGKKQLPRAQEQIEAFTAIADQCARAGSKTISLHSVKAAAEVLDILQHTGALDTCTCIFHWFSDSNDILHRAIKAGCFFSVGPFMAASRRGREYLKVIPVERMLLETDAPPTMGESSTRDIVTGEPRTPYSYELLRDGLVNAAEVIAQVKGPEALEVIAKTSERLLCSGQPCAGTLTR